MRYAVVTQAWTDRPLRSSAIVRIDVLTIVWSRAPRNMPSISPDRIVRICRWVYSPAVESDAGAATGLAFSLIDAQPIAQVGAFVAGARTRSHPVPAAESGAPGSRCPCRTLAAR